MVVDVKLCREEGKPFGFRLIGGADFEIPLTCSKVSEEKKNCCRHRDEKCCDISERCVFFHINNISTQFAMIADRKVAGSSLINCEKAHFSD